MTLDEAIKLLSKWQSGLRTTPMDDVAGAVQLGIEALKRLRASRDPKGFVVVGPLPGETAE